MQSLDPLRPESVSPEPNKATSQDIGPSATDLTVSSENIAQQASDVPKGTFSNKNPSKKIEARFRFRPDSWLPLSDANLLLRKRAQWAVKQKNYAVALDVLNHLVAYEPDCADHWVNRGLVQDYLKQWDEALDDYSRAIELNPELDRAYSNRANLYARQHNWIAALTDYDEALDLNPLNVKTRLNQAITFRDVGDYTEALVCFDIAIFFRPDSATIFAERGRTYQMYGDWNCATADYKRALQLTSRQEPDFINFSQLQPRVVQWLSELSAN